MAAKVELTPLPPFDPTSEPSSLDQRWKSWIKRFETYLTAMNVTEDKQKRALLLYQAGQATQEIFETIPDNGADYATAKESYKPIFCQRRMSITKSSTSVKLYRQKKKLLTNS